VDILSDLGDISLSAVEEDFFNIFFEMKILLVKLYIVC